MDGSRTMEQDDKVSAAALSLGSATGSSARTARTMGSSDRAGGPAELASDAEPSSAVRGARNVRDAARETEEDEDEAPEDIKSGGTPSTTPKKSSNNVRRIRIERMMSKAELARRANLSVLTIDRVERGYGCRMDTKRKILEALGLSLADRVRVFGEEE
ncbi:MAG: helix-turn-helix transcriptional regulator [Myxococcales bacterium]